MLDAEHVEGLADDGVPDRMAAGHALDLRVTHYHLVEEGAMHGDVDGLVDGGGDEETAMLAVVRRQVGAATTERDPQRTPGNDHWRLSSRSQAEPGTALSCRLRLLLGPRDGWPVFGRAARRSLACSAVPGGAWDRGVRCVPRPGPSASPAWRSPAPAPRCTSA